MAVPFYACTARATLQEIEVRGDLLQLQEAGVEIVADTCVVVTPILRESGGLDDEFGQVRSLRTIEHRIRGRIRES